MSTEIKPKLTAKMRLIARQLAAGSSARQVAQESKLISHQTIYRWQQLPVFRDFLNGLIDQHDSEADALLRSLRLRAVQRLCSLLESENQQVALRSAEAILDRQRTMANSSNEFRQDSTPIDVRQIMKGLGIRYEQ